MPGFTTKVHRDTDYLVTGTQKGATGTTVIDTGKDFKSCGVVAGLALKNDTAGTTGTVSSGVTENSFVSSITIANGATYRIFKTTSYNSKISTHYEDRRAGHKVTEKSQLSDRGYLPEDVDVDESNTHAWGPGEPWR